jgi:hypothetical protein
MPVIRGQITNAKAQRAQVARSGKQGMSNRRSRNPESSGSGANSNMQRRGARQGADPEVLETNAAYTTGLTIRTASLQKTGDGKDS